MDFVCGTSIGGLIGGIIAIGYTADDIHELFRTQNWPVTLSDDIDPKYQKLVSKQFRDKYLLSIPFHYSKEDLARRKADNDTYSLRRNTIKVGAKPSMKSTQKDMSAFISSLPSGYVNGFNVNNLLSSLTVGYQDSISFAHLPVPYMCVAADLVSCKSKNWSSGSLKTAMRSTMSIPGLFEPVKGKGLVLVDGGTRNNYPVDLAMAAGADYIIGIELSDTDLEYGEVNNLGDIFSQFITMLGTEAFTKNKDKAFIKIKPDLSGYGMLSFTGEAVDTMFNRGYAAAAAVSEEIAELKARVYVSGEPANKPFRKAIDLSKESICVETVDITGVSRKEAQYILRKANVAPGSEVDKKKMDEAMSKLQATGCFESVSYTITGETAPYGLVFNCVPAPVHRFGFGFRIDNEEWASLLVNLGLNTQKISASKFDFSFKAGTNLQLDARYSLDLVKLPVINFDYQLRFNRGDLYYRDIYVTGDILPTPTAFKYLSNRGRIYFSGMRLTSLIADVGVQFRDYRMDERWINETMYSPFFAKNYRASYFGPFASILLKTTDTKYYPTRGVDLKLKADFDLCKLGEPKFAPVMNVGLDFKFVIPICKFFAIIPDLHARVFAPFNGDYSAMSEMFSHMNYVGGAIPGRYIEDQIPFIGTKDVFMAKNWVGICNLDLRFNPIKNVYVSLLGGVGRDADNFKEMTSEGLRPTLWGVGAEVGYNSIFGPLKARINWSNIDQRIDYYISLGFDF